MLRKICTLVIVFIIPIAIYAGDSDYKEWEKHDVKALYSLCSKNEADEKYEDTWSRKTLYFKKYRRLSRGVYNVEVSEKVDSKIWKIKGTDLYMFFRFNPFLFRYDEGVLEWDGYSGTFYKKP